MKPIVETIMSEMNVQMEGEVLKAVQKVGFNVDKERLTKALLDSRRFYFEGYEDAKRESGWIPVSERLPECEDGWETGALLFQLKETNAIWCGYYGVSGRYRDKYFRPYTDHMDGFDAEDVIAWMPLPEPYQKVGEAE